MKIILLFVINLLFITEAFSQVSYGGVPLSFGEYSNQEFSGQRKISNNIITIKDLDRDVIQKDIDSFSNDCVDCNSRFYYGKEVEVDVDFFKMADFFETPTKDKIWKLKFESEKSEGFQFIFSKFQLAEGGELFIYNEEKTMLLGSFTSNNNRADSTFLTQFVNGANVYIEYSAPASAEESIIYISKVVYIFDNCFTINKGPYSNSNSGAAKCQINTTCYEGKGYDTEIKSTVMILEKTDDEYWGICTGALINDGTNYINKSNPYLLSANHCYELEKKKKFAEVKDWLFIFRHEATSCDTNGSDISRNSTKSALGAKVISRDEGSDNNDYLLIELSNTINDIAAYDIAFAGYDLNSYSVEPGNLASPTVSIQHPQGDVKKILISKEPAISDGWNKAGNDHWNVTTTIGFKTEPAASGAPLFNSSHQVIGTCHGGNNDITCGSPKNQWVTTYGKLSVANMKNDIMKFLTTISSDSYTPKVSEKESLNRINPIMINSIIDHGSPQMRCEWDASYKADNEQAIIRCIVYKNPFDNSNYGPIYDYNDSRYFYEARVVSFKRSSNSTSTSASYTFDLPVFIEAGEYRAIIIGTRSSDNYEARTIKEFIITVTPPGICKCGTFNLEIVNPQKKYAPGSSIIAKEEALLLNKPVFASVDPSPDPRPLYGCYGSDYIRNKCSGFWQPSYIGVETRVWSYDKNIISEENFNTTVEYIKTNPGKYYMPSSQKLELKTPGVHKVQAIVNLALRYKDMNSDCLPPKPNTIFEKFTTHPLRTFSAEAKIIVANCDTLITVTNINSPLLSPFSSDEKEVGARVIEIKDVELPTNKSFAIEAYQTIVLKPGTVIKKGSSFHARIVPCPSVSHTTELRTRKLEENQIIDIAKDEIIIFPNPTIGIINVQTFRNTKLDGAEIYNMNGKLVKTKSDNINPYAMDISNQSNGVYILKLYSNQGVTFHKIMLKK